MKSQPNHDRRLIQLAPEDNCLVAASDLEAGDSVTIDGQSVTLTQAIYIGHKLARHNLKSGEKIIKYGAPIGHVTRSVAIGEHLHLQNLVSDYIPTYTHAEGTEFVSH